MPNQYPPLSPRDVCKIALALGWEEVKPPRTAGDHKYFSHPNKKHHLQVDMGKDEFWTDAIKNIIRRMEISREEFYGATKRTAKKIASVTPKKKHQSDISVSAKKKAS